MKSNNKRGFTLMEAVIVIILLAIGFVGLAGFIYKAADSWVFVKSREAALSSGRVAMERMVREMRRIKKPNNIIVAASSECEFLDVDLALINFRQSGTDLLRNDIALASNVLSPDGLAFTYYDGSMNVTSVKQDMRYIKVKLSLVRGKETVILEDGVRIRNL